MIHLYWHLRSGLAAIICLCAFTFFSIFVPGFLQVGNLFALMHAFGVLALVSVGLAIVMLAGEFDLSTAGTVPLASVVAVKLSEQSGLFVGCSAAFLVSLAVGAINGWLVARTRISSLAITVGTMVLTIGLGFTVAAGQVVVLSDYSAGMWLDSPLGGLFSPGILIQLGLVLLLLAIMKWSWFGIFVRAVGNDSNRAKSAGISATTTLLGVFLICAACAGIAGMIEGISLASGSPGEDSALLLRATTAAIVGGVALAGGSGKIYGVVSAAMLLAVVGNGVSLSGTPEPIVQLINGGILLLIVIVDRPLQHVAGRFLQ